MPSLASSSNSTTTSTITTNSTITAKSHKKSLSLTTIRAAGEISRTCSTKREVMSHVRSLSDSQRMVDEEDDESILSAILDQEPLSGDSLYSPEDFLLHSVVGKPESEEGVHAFVAKQSRERRLQRPREKGEVMSPTSLPPPLPMHPAINDVTDEEEVDSSIEEAIMLEKCIRRASRSGPSRSNPGRFVTTEVVSGMAVRRTSSGEIHSQS